jgi:hypothetical protein
MTDTAASVLALIREQENHYNVFTSYQDIQRKLGLGDEDTDAALDELFVKARIGYHSEMRRYFVRDRVLFRR